ncbi:hypothetical protein [Niabella beijingensis]|uniref:hypothetical protein n=1 Tax=Niabella beijingensis TaxID=2872700 RepID=UPI001CBB36D5|nr:hypothetical protein [Niabella beijingensis]MBZ4190506.1 hypothetical protein [Niabella beijingensis]
MRPLNTKRLCRNPGVYVTGLLFLSSISFTAGAQTIPRKQLVGISTGMQWTEGRGIRPAVTLSYEWKFTPHSSIETGLKYTNYSQIRYYAPNAPYGITSGGKDHYFTLPVLYKYSSRIVNIAAGPTLNLMTGRSFPEGWTPRPYQKEPRKLAIGYQFKVSKTFDLTERLVLEPEVSVFGSEYFKKPQGEVGVGFKYRF